jgi:hypothetical protein
VADLDIVTIKDRQVPIKKLNETQRMLLLREARVLSKARDGSLETERVLRGIAFMLDIVESSIVDADDREWLMNLAGSGEIDFGEMLKISTAFEEQPEPDAKPVRRSRAASITRK